MDASAYGELPPLSMSQTKDELLRHLSMTSETYAMMAKEADGVYKWLTSDKTHLKKNCKRKPPYDWSDIQEKAKDDAMVRIAQGQSDHTRFYWQQATPTSDCPNWIARWFLYHKFRYRDGRNRNTISKGSNDESSHHDHRHRSISRSDETWGSITSGSYSGSVGIAYSGYYDGQTNGDTGQETAQFYDPARDTYRPA